MSEVSRHGDAPCLYAIALGSNRRHGRYGAPAATIRAALAALEAAGLEIFAVSPILSSAPVGPSSRRFANAAALVATPLHPRVVLNQLKRVERDFGRRRGRRWGARVLDLDIILWSEGRWTDRHLRIPHPLWTTRDFVARPLATIAADWFDPVAGLTVRQVAARLAKFKPRANPAVDHRR